MECRVTQLSPLQRLWLTETVRLREEHAGPLEDLEANRLARTAGGDLPTRIQQRALHLAERSNDLRDLQQRVLRALLGESGQCQLPPGARVQVRCCQAH